MTDQPCQEVLGCLKKNKIPLAVKPDLLIDHCMRTGTKLFYKQKHPMEHGVDLLSRHKVREEIEYFYKQHASTVVYDTDRLGILVGLYMK